MRLAPYNMENLFSHLYTFEGPDCSIGEPVLAANKNVNEPIQSNVSVKSVRKSNCVFNQKKDETSDCRSKFTIVPAQTSILHIRHIGYKGALP